MKKKAIRFGIFLAVLLSLLAWWGFYLYPEEAIYTGKFFWLEPDFEALNQIEEKGTAEYWALIDNGITTLSFKAVVPVRTELPFGQRKIDKQWQIIFFFGLFFTSSGAVVIWGTGEEEK